MKNREKAEEEILRSFDGIGTADFLSYWASLVDAEKGEKMPEWIHKALTILYDLEAGGGYEVELRIRRKKDN